MALQFEKMRPGDVLAYLRVSKGDGSMSPENQLPPLEQWAKASGRNIAQVVIEEESTRKTRPLKDQIMRAASMGIIPEVGFIRLDRWGRSLSELTMDFERMCRGGAKVTSLRDLQTIDPLSTFGRLQLNMIGAFAEFERGLIHDRTMEGLARAEAEGRKGGRPRKYCAVCGSHKSAGCGCFERKTPPVFSGGPAVRKIAG